MIRYLVITLFIINLTSGEGTQIAEDTFQEDSEISAENVSEETREHKLGKYLYKKFNKKDLDKCCQQPGMALNEQILGNCGQHLFNAQESEEKNDGKTLGEKHLCAIECVFENFGAFNNDAFTSPEFLGEGFKHHGNFLGIYVDNYDFCVNRTVEALKSFPNAEQAKAEMTCNPSPTMFMICLRSQGLINCPDEMWNGAEQKCNELREKLIEYERLL